jgi:hypothetical protein
MMANLDGRVLRVVSHRYGELLCEDISRGEPSGRYVILSTENDTEEIKAYDLTQKEIK